MIAGLIALAGSLVAIAVLARREDHLIDRFWSQALASPLIPSLLSHLHGLEQAIDWTRQRVRELRKAGDPVEAARIEGAGQAFERKTRLERRRLGRLRRIVRAAR